MWRQGLKSFVWILSSGYCLDAFPGFVYCTRLTLKLCSSLICSSARDPIIAFTNAKIETRKVILRFHGLNCLVMLPNFCNFVFNGINSLILPIFKDGPRPHFFRQITSKLIWSLPSIHKLYGLVRSLARGKDIYPCCLPSVFLYTHEIVGIEVLVCSGNFIHFTIKLPHITLHSFNLIRKTKLICITPISITSIMSFNLIDAFSITIFKYAIHIILIQR